MKTTIKISALDCVFLIACICSGGFFEYISCAISVALGIYLTVKIWKQKHIKIKKTSLLTAVIGICAGYGLSCFWAVDSGMAWIGFCKFLPLVLYLVSLWQTDSGNQLRCFLPFFGAITVALSVVGMHIPGLEHYFSVAGRFAGTFQYPNTYALFLLVCELLFVTQDHTKKWHYFVLLSLVVGLLYTGSRTVFVLFVISNVVLIVLRDRKTVKFLLLMLAGMLVFGAVIMVWGRETVLYRYLMISLTESTFIGRVLYFVDALPLLLRYPFGMGYMGYYYVQSSLQSGAYSVVYVHNDFLQLFLDIGWLPGILFVAAIIRWLFNKSVALNRKVIVGTIVAHMLFDFDLQFIFMFLLLIWLLDEEDAQICELRCLPVKIGAIAIVAISLYMVVPLALAHMELRQASNKLYPFNTQNQLKMLEQEQDIAAINQISLDILARNKEYYVPYSVQSQYAYSKGDFAAVMKNKRLALEKAPFCHEEYAQYCAMLINGAQVYLQNGDAQSAQICHQELCEVAQLLTNAQNKMSALGKMIKDQPRFDLPEDIQAYIDALLEGEESPELA